MMYLGTDTKTDERRARRVAFARLMAVLADLEQATLGDLAAACGDDPKLTLAEGILLEAANMGLVAESRDQWRIIANEARFAHQADAAERLRVGASTVSRWVRDGILCDPPVVYVAEGGLVTFPKPRPVQASLPIAEDQERGVRFADPPAELLGLPAPDSVPPASAPPAPVHPSRPPAPTPPVAPAPAVIELPLAMAAKLAQDLGEHPAGSVLAKLVVDRVAQGAA